jgi:alpha-L-fucosidase
MQALGATSGVLTAKHGCGFLGWVTNTTLPDGTPYTYHAPEELAFVPKFAAAMQEAGLGYGYYYSLTNNYFLNELGHNVQPPSTLLPGQANVTQAQYEEIALAQMRELWTQFGNLTEVWMDGGCGDMCDKAAALLAETPAINAVVFNGGSVSPSPVRWCGTEGGNPPGWPTVWSTAACGWCPDGSGSGAPPNTTGAIWYPSGVDVTLQQDDHWFWDQYVGTVSLPTLIDYYQKSVGANGHMELDFAISRTGELDPSHVAMYKQFGDWIRNCYGTPLATASLVPGQTNVTVTLPGGPVGASFDRISMEEDQTTGQLIISYAVDYEPSSAPGTWVEFSSGETIGSKRIDVMPTGPVDGTQVRVSITSAFALPKGLTVSVFAADSCRP